VPVRFQGVFAASTAAAALWLPPALQASTFEVTLSNWGTASEERSLAWALAQANGNPGADTIRFSPGLTVAVDDATPGPDLWLATVSDALRIEGRGATLVGQPAFLSSAGITHTKTNVDRFTPPPAGTDILLQSAFSFAKVAPGVSLHIDGLAVDGLNGFLQLGAGATASVADAAARNSVSYGGTARSLFEALDGSVLNLSSTVIERIHSPLLAVGAAWEGVIAGTNASLNMLSSRISQASAAVVVWSGGVANIVSSMMTESGGISVRDDSSQGVINLVNSLVAPSSQNADLQRLQALAGGELSIVASTIVQDALSNRYDGCVADPYGCVGKPLTALAGGTIRLRESVVSLLNADLPGLIPAGIASYSDAALGSGSGGTLQALDALWIQTTPNQSAATLAGLFHSPALLTSGSPLLVDAFGFGVSGYRPWPEGASPNPLGPLIDAVADADGFNQLLNPIDFSVITEDLLGQPRSRGGRRDLGAIQAEAVPAPLPWAGVVAALARGRRLRRRLHRDAVDPAAISDASASPAAGGAGVAAVARLRSS
jgi:hypothetical protein